MTTIEDRLRADAGHDSALADWEDVIDRAGARAETQKMVFRAAVAAFVVLAGAAWFLGGSGSADSIESFDLAQPAPSDDPNSAPWTEPSPIGIMAAWFLAWGGSLVVGALGFYLSARHLRAPYIFTRQARAASVAAIVAHWSAALLALTIAAGSVVQADLLRWLYPEVRWILLASFAVFGLVLVFAAERGVLLLIVFLLVATNVATATIPADFDDVTRMWGPAVSLSSVVIILLLINYSFRQLGYELDQRRMRDLVAPGLTGRRVLGAVLVIGGLGAAIVVMAPTIVFQQQASALMPEFDGFEREAFSSSAHPLVTNTGPFLRITYTPPRPVEGGAPLFDYLESEGFEVQSQEDGDPFRVYRRPRGDAFEAITAEALVTGESRAWVEFSPESRSAFDGASRIRNLGYALAWVGVLLWWSETAISRFLTGPNPWRRRSRTREQTGWAAVVVAGLVPLVSVVTGGFGSGTSSGFLLEVFLMVLVWLVGVWLVVPKPPLPPEDDLLSEQAGDRAPRAE